MGMRSLLIAGGRDNHPYCWLSADPALSPFLAPQIRRAAQHGVCSILKGSEFMFGEKAPAHHPAAISTAKFCIQEIEKSGGGAARWSGWGRAGGSCREWAGVSAAPLSARLQGGHHHAAHADPAEGPTALLPRRPGEELQRDSPAGHDLEPCGELMPQCMGVHRGGGGQSFRPQACVLALRKLTVQAKSGSWGLLAPTLLLATPEDASHPWSGADSAPRAGR